MALPINIEEMLTGQTVEWERIEFKAGWNPEKILQTICAFLNDINNWGGGYIAVGIAENQGRPVLPPKGLRPSEIDSIQNELLNLCNLLKPPAFPVVEPVIFQKKRVLIIWVPGGQNRPYQAPVSLGKKGQHAYYIRRFANTVKARIEDQKELVALAGTIPYDDRIHHSAEITDLKLTLIQSFLREIGSDLYRQASDMPFVQLCKQMMIVDGTTEYLKPRNAGLLFFNDLPQKYIPMSQIEVVQFPETPGDDRLNEKIFQGPIHQQVRDVLTYLKNVILREYVQKLPDKAEAIRFFNYPYVALEESIVNAMYHRSYEIREPVEIRIHPDRIEILSFPGPDRSIKKSDLEKGILVARRYRNRRIGEIYKELKMTEGRCTGIPKIIRAMDTNGSLPPIFKTDDDRTFFLTILKVHPQFNERIDDERKKQPEAQLKSWLKSQLKSRKVPLRDKVVFLLSEGQLSKSEISTEIGQKQVSGQLHNIMRTLLDEEIIAYTIPDKPKSRLQKYRLTQKGEVWLKESIG